MRFPVLALVVLGLTASAEEKKPQPMRKVQRRVLVELFTSQG